MPVPVSPPSSPCGQPPPATQVQWAVPAAVQTVEQAIGWAAGVLESFELCYGHGTDNAFDEAAALVFHAGGYAHEDAATVYPRALPPAAAATLGALLERRVNERLPSAYLTGRTWFAGLEMRCGPGVLVPRSPLAELIVERFHPLLDATRLQRIVANTLCYLEEDMSQVCLCGGVRAVRRARRGWRHG